MILCACGILRKDTSELIYKMEIDPRHRKQADGCQRRKAGAGINHEFGI